ncbi:MAG: hypothetical protein Q4G35_03180 [Propionibacteriaceae bacterium]|nr:hypothetical protein [Propionibacteriaceae bacterium]
MIPDLTDRDTWPDPYLDELRVAVLIEQERRRVLDTAPQQAEDLATRYDNATRRQDGDPWTDRGHLGYPGGAVVTHDGETWTSKASYNTWEPGTDGGHAWTRQAPAPDEDGPAPWGEAIAYQVGDLVTHDGTTWRCKRAHTSHSGWAPSAATHAVWETA